MSSVSSPYPLTPPPPTPPPPPFRRATLWEVREETNDISDYYELVIANLLPPLWLSALEE